MTQETKDLLCLYKDGAVFTAFDTETTGLEPEKNSVIEIGAVKFDINGVKARYSVLVNPQIKIPNNITELTGITNFMVENERDFAQTADDFLYFIKDTILVAHNAPFDLGFINEELKRCQKNPLTNKVLDTLTLSKKILPSFGKYNLQFLAKTLEIFVTNAHRAEDDARVCMELFDILAKKFFETQNY